jgi:predicted dehydrogenase
VAEQTAARFEIPRVCGSVEELLSLHDVDIVDLAVPARHNPSLTTQALRAGKHVLAQKPMAETLSEAETMVSEAQRNKRKLAINHQMRWSPSVRAASDLLRKNYWVRCWNAQSRFRFGRHGTPGHGCGFIRIQRFTITAFIMSMQCGGGWEIP